MLRRATGRIAASRVLAAAVLLAPVACGPSALSQRVDATVFSWVQCQDCMHNQRSRVIALGDTAVPLLREILIVGPPISHDSAYVASLTRLAQRTPGLTPVIVERQRQMFAAVYRRRALSALEGIATSAAKSSVCLARATLAPASPIVPAIDSSIGSAGPPCP